ncbi:hypothetical protein [Rhizobium yanglingense]
MNIRPQYYARRDGDGSWSIIDTQTHKVAVIADTVPLTRLDEATALGIIDELRRRHSASREHSASAEGTNDGLSHFN